MPLALINLTGESKPAEIEDRVNGGNMSEKTFCSVAASWLVMKRVMTMILAYRRPSRNRCSLAFLSFREGSRLIGAGGVQ
jgi:hypothetical protein